MSHTLNNSIKNAAKSHKKKLFVSQSGRDFRVLQGFGHPGVGGILLEL